MYHIYRKKPQKNKTIIYWITVIPAFGPRKILILWVIHGRYLLCSNTVDPDLRRGDECFCSVIFLFFTVIPAKAGIYCARIQWTPACAGVTGVFGWLVILILAVLQTYPAPTNKNCWRRRFPAWLRQATHNKNCVFAMGPFSGTSFADRPEPPGPHRGIRLGAATAGVSTIRCTIRRGIRAVEHPTRKRRVCHPAPAITTFIIVCIIMH